MSDINGMSIAELEKLISSRKSVLTGLYSRRDQIAKQMDAINAEIAAAEGSAGAGNRGRPATFARSTTAVKRKAPSAAVTRSENEKSLKAYVIDVLTASRRGLSLSEIQEAVLKVGYITHSANFKNTLYQCLYHNEDLFILDKQSKCYKLGK
jgi:hypothetical protein